MKICKTCGSEYEIKEHKMIHRDVDEILCEVCGQVLMSWNGAVSYSATLVKMGLRRGQISSGTTAYKIENGNAINTNILVEAGPCEVISPKKAFNMMASELFPVSGLKEFYQVKNPGNLFVLATFVSFDI